MYRSLRRPCRLTLRWVRCDEAQGQLDWDDFEKAVTPRTRLVAIGAASNAIGTINDVARATAERENVKVNYVRGDIGAFESEPEYDAAICLFDAFGFFHCRRKTPSRPSPAISRPPLQA